jgi:hypothetical protein
VDLKFELSDPSVMVSPSPLRDPVQSGGKKRTPLSCKKRQSAPVDTDAAPAVVQPSKPAAIKAKTISNKPTQAERHALQRQEMACIMARINKDGFELKHVEPDGSCLFRALSLQVRSTVVITGFQYVVCFC